METVIFYGLITSIFAGAKAHKDRVEKKMISANFFGIIGIVAFVVAVTQMT